MPGAVFPLLSKKERDRYAKQMDHMLKLLKKSTDAVEKIAKQMETLNKTFTGTGQG